MPRCTGQHSEQRISDSAAGQRRSHQTLQGDPVSAIVEEAQPLSPVLRFDRADAVRGIVERFYDQVETEPAFVELRAMHADDLARMRIAGGMARSAA